jgi:hypothetical protein
MSRTTIKGRTVAQSLETAVERLRGAVEELDPAGDAREAIPAPFGCARRDWPRAPDSRLASSSAI